MLKLTLRCLLTCPLVAKSWKATCDALWDLQLRTRMPDKLELFRLLQAPRAKDFVLCNSQYKECSSCRDAYEFDYWARQWVLEVVVNLMEKDSCHLVASTTTHYCETIANANEPALQCKHLDTTRLPFHDKRYTFTVYLHKKKHSKRVMLMKWAGRDAVDDIKEPEPYITDQGDHCFRYVYEWQPRLFIGPPQPLELVIYSVEGSGFCSSCKDFASLLEYWFATEGST